MAFQISKFQLNDARFLIYKPSTIAASSVILAINIYEKDKEQQSNKGFFNNCKYTNGLQELNLDIWNNQTVHSMTGYSMQDIKPCLVELSQFICNNLSPNRLEGFDITSIMAVPQYSL